jgi:hypothetical protein
MSDMSEDPNDNPKLEQALRRLEKDRIFVPPSRDQEMLVEIRKHFDPATPALRPEEVIFSSSKVRRVRPRPRIWQKWLPLAASAAIAALVLYFSRPPKHQQADLNRDGAINVVDALILAERTRDGKGVDINGDGLMDGQDAADIAERAVDLERSGS